MLEIKNLTKIYDNKKLAVDDVSLTIEAGDIFGFVGHNGAGKSTTIKSVVGLINFDKGSIKINGMDIKKMPLECKKIIHYIPDSPDIYLYLKGITFLNFIAQVYEVDEQVKNERINYYSELFGIKEELGNTISTYSHGMRQKLNIISALLHQPKLLILDEPFVGLDPVASHNLKNIFKEMCANGSAIFFSSHVLEVVEKLCNKIAIIKSGKIITMGNIDEVRGDKSLESLFVELSDE